MNCLKLLNYTSKKGFFKCQHFIRNFTLSTTLKGKRNFRKFIYHDRGTPLDKKYFEEHPELVDQRGARPTGYWTDEEGKKVFVEVPEMVPDLVVPDLTNFTLKPYVSYRTNDIVQEKFTPEHLFYAVYAKKIEQDLKENKLDEQGNPMEPSKEESMSAEEAWTKARLTGSDLFG